MVDAQVNAPPPPTHTHPTGHASLGIAHDGEVCAGGVCVRITQKTSDRHWVQCVGIRATHTPEVRVR